MPRVVHVIVTRNFAGAERYVCDAARETAARGWEVAVVGGQPETMRRALGGEVAWRPGSTPSSAVRSLIRLGRRDVCHAHMTVAEAVALAGRPFHRAPVVVTRHFASHRGSSRAGRLAAPLIRAGVAREIAVSDFVAREIERAPDAVIHNGVSPSPLLWRPENRAVIVVQRLEPEKETWTALRAWQLSGLAHVGWTLRVVGDGSERPVLEARAKTDGLDGVEFAGWRGDVARELASAGILLAVAPAEPFGLSVIEAMAAGVPVVASAAGGHLETVGLLPAARLFPPRDAAAAAESLRSLLDESARAELSAQGRELVTRSFTIARHVDALLDEYAYAMRTEQTEPKRATGAAAR